MKKILTLLALMFTSSCFAQNYADFIGELARRSVEFKANRAQFTADSLSNRLGLNPDNPELDVEYSFDNSTEVVISQSFDFPTVYGNRNKLSKLNITRAEVGMKMSNWDLMTQISEQYVNLIYHTKLVKLLNDRAERLNDYVAKVQRGVELGENTRLDLEGAKTLASQMHTELLLALSAKQQCENTLRKWGIVRINENRYPSFAPLAEDEFVVAARAANLSLEAARVDSLIAQRSLKLSQSEWIPKIKVGYKMAFEGGSTRSGVVAGLSIPLWQKRGNVKYSKALIRNAEIQNEATRLSVETSLVNLYSEYQSSELAMNTYPSDNMEYINLLRKSLASGSITSSEFLLSVVDRYNVQQRYLELEMEHIQTRALMEILMAN